MQYNNDLAQAMSTEGLSASQVQGSVFAPQMQHQMGYNGMQQQFSSFPGRQPMMQNGGFQSMYQPQPNVVPYPMQQSMGTRRYLRAPPVAPLVVGPAEWNVAPQFIGPPVYSTPLYSTPVYGSSFYGPSLYGQSMLGSPEFLFDEADEPQMLLK
jgi:hypothetical protein